MVFQLVDVGTAYYPSSGTFGIAKPDKNGVPVIDNGVALGVPYIRFTVVFLHLMKTQPSS